jgi:hypothetical protein
MKKEKIFIVVTHKKIINKAKKVGSRKPTEGDWEVVETVEFVNQLKPKHNQTASAIGDYVNRKMLLGAHKGMDDYNIFENYIKVKYSKQMAELDSVYKELQVSEEPIILPTADTEPEDLVQDEFGNVRQQTVFDSVVQ